jgi:hypothetical protein
VALAGAFETPTVDDIAPEEGSMLGDTKLVLRGSHLLRETIVRVDGVLCTTVGAREPSELEVRTPPGTRAGAVDVSVLNPGCHEVTVKGGFRYLPLPAPSIEVVAPAHVPTKGGAELSIVGKHFVHSTEVHIDGKPMSAVRIVDATTIHLDTPAGDDGRVVDVEVRNPDGQSALAKRAFMYDARYD